MTTLAARVYGYVERRLAYYLWVGIWCALVTMVTGCWAPFRSPGIPATTLPEIYRMPYRTAGPPLNFAYLTIAPPSDYLLGTNDILEITVAGLYEGAETTPLRVQVMASGEIHLPLVGAVRVGGMNLLEAQRAITAAYADGFMNDPRVNVALGQKSTVDVVVLGRVNQPGVHVLPKYENDVGHALAAAQGLADDAADVIEVHRKPTKIEGQHQIERLPPVFPPLPLMDPSGCHDHAVVFEDTQQILRIPLRGPGANQFRTEDIVLHPGDVVVVPSRRHEVFYVVGQLNRVGTARFTIGDRERELGFGFVLPRDREIDVVTAVVMAGYLDPIDSPTTVTVHRVRPDGQPMLIHVDLIKARYDRNQTIFVQPGDIIYLNPDAPWWLRRTFDRIVPDGLLIPYTRWIVP